MRPLALLPLVVLLAACATGPRYKMPAPDPPDVWVAAADASTERGRVAAGPREAVARDWWKDLGDPVLDELMDVAARENFDLKLALARVQEARASRAATAARLYPEVNGAAAASRGNNAFFGQERPLTVSEAAFDATWEADLFGANRSRVSASDAIAGAASYNAAAVLLSLRAEVARNYVELRAAQNRLVLALDTVRARRDTAGLVRSLRAAGLRSELDVTQAETQALALEAQIPPLRTAVTASARRIDTLVGRNPGSFEAELAATKAVPLPEAPAVLDQPAAVIARRPDLERASRELAAATALSGAAVADLYPKVSLGGLFGVRNISALGGLGIWSLAAGAVMPIFNAGRLQAEVDAADARQQQAYFAYRQAVLAALEEVEVSVVAYVNADRNRRVLDVLVENEANKLALAEERYRRGLSPFIDVLDAQRSLFSAQTDRVSAEAEVAKGYVALNKALGG
jgi:outer membrane protein, multidrug efflux system